MSLRDYIPKTKKAAWTQTPAGRRQIAKADKQRAERKAGVKLERQARQRQRLVDAGTHLDSKKQSRRATKRRFIRRERPEHALARAEYNARVKVWLMEPGNQFCWVMIARFQAGEVDAEQIAATQCHHKRGRLGSLLMDERFWIPVSAYGHSWIDANRERARELGLLAEKGDWHKL